MNNKEIENYNRLCAEFLNLHKDEETVIYKMESYSYDYLKFHSDWNWIMEVVEKIQTLDRRGGIVMIQQGRCKITSRMVGDNSVYADISHYYLHGLKKQKEAVVEAINQFLIWYNKI